MFTGIFVKILSIMLLVAVGIVLILGIGTLFKGGSTSKKYSNKLMQLRVLLQFVAIILLVVFHRYPSFQQFEFAPPRLLHSCEITVHNMFSPFAIYRKNWA